MSDHSIETVLAHLGGGVDSTTGAVVPPLQPSTTYARGPDHELIGDHGYARYGSPTVARACVALARIEDGHDALLFASGMGAFTAFVESMAHGADIVVPSVMYHGGSSWLRRLADDGRVRLRFFDAADPEGVATAVTAETEVVWIESPVNPTWDVIDIAAAAEAAHAAGAELVVDSTVAPAVTTRPLSLGADYVFHSGTKYLNGHSDVLAGVLVTAAPTERWAEIFEARGLLGAAPGAFEAWLLMRGMRTMALRYTRASQNALAIANALETNPHVERVLYPGLASHPGHAIATRQMTGGFGGMLSLLVRGTAEEAQRVTTRTEVFVPATSLGGVESLIEYRRAVEPPESEVPDTLIRLSVGIEAADDLVADLERALAAVLG